ncbi:MAG TPA: hypothetical protein VJM34_07580 [Novosphingobium sp.]|nr:hypothetical protein [Novosphingobium sp.]
MRILASIAALGLAACAAARADAPSSPPQPAYPGEVTKVLSQRDADRLLANTGLTLQWLDWGRTRGMVVVSKGEGLWSLRGAQAQADGPGRLLLDGAILEIGQGYFTFRGKVRITDTPDPGRLCEKDKTWHFAVTQNRPYYRLREFEWCDGLTDYVDVYFKPGS